PLEVAPADPGTLPRRSGSPMQVVLFASGHAPHAARALQALAGIDPTVCVDVCGHSFRLLRIVRGLGVQPSVVVLVPGDRADLEELVRGRADLEDRRLLLVLPDDDAETVALGHLLRPRAVCFAWSPAAELRSILARMLLPVEWAAPTPRAAAGEVP
ncbi:MAG: hypothetical protein AB1578_14965, partial [Thermodesulfobacteriota bacterium]